MRRGNPRLGSALVEFALSFGFLFSALAGAFEFGRSFQIYNTLQSAVRDAARYASRRAYDSSTAAPSAAFLDAVRKMAVYGDPAGSGKAVAPGLAAANVALTIAFDDGVPYQVTVAIVNYPVGAVFTRLMLNGKPKATFPYLGRYAPPA